MLLNFASDLRSNSLDPIDKALKFDVNADTLKLLGLMIIIPLVDIGQVSVERN